MADLPTVVVVDDASDVRALVRTRLRLSHRFEVVAEGGTGREAVELAGRHEPSLMLLDVSMPEMDGLQALPEVLAASPSTRVVLFSGFDSEGLSERGLALGASAFIEKSASIDELVEGLSAVLAGTSEEPPPPAPPDVDQAVLDAHLERFREVFDQAAIGMATLTLTGRIVRANRAIAALLGTVPQELVGAEYAALAGDDRPQFEAALHRLLDDGADVTQVEHRVRGRGAARHLRTTLAAVRGQVRQPLYLFVQAQDVTEQHRVVEQLRQSEERFRLLVEAVEDYAIFMLDPDGNIASWNAGAQRAKGYSAEEIVGRHFRTFYPRDKQEARHPEHELEVALRDGRYEEEGWRVRKDGSTFWANVVITTLRNAEGEHVGFTKVTRDITARAAAAEERERAATALAQANAELEGMNARLTRAAADQAEFLAVTAHELRGPVGVLGGAADTLAQHWADLAGEERGELLDGMTDSARRLRRLLADLLTAARLESGAVQLDLQPVEVRGLLEAAVSTVLATEDAEVVVEAPEGLAARADRDRFAQAVENLLGNALLHGRPPVHLSAQRVGEHVEVHVSDNGDGVPEHLRDRLFQRFATGRHRRGTGLGLYIVRELARAQGGDARYEAADGARPGRFVLALPGS